MALLPKASSNSTLPNRRLRVFLCHASSDKRKVRNLAARLRESAIEPWLDEERLMAGQDWETEIRRALREADVVIVCLSKNALNKQGYVQSELKFALDIAEKQPLDSIFLVPVKLEACEIPDRLKHLHYIEYYLPRGHERLIEALNAKAKSLNLAETHSSYQSILYVLRKRLVLIPGILVVMAAVAGLLSDGWNVFDKIMPTTNGESTQIITPVISAAIPITTTVITEPESKNIGDYIYQIKAECNTVPNLRIQTGTRIQGYSGIVTALHGVVGCNEIMAFSSSKTLTNELQILPNLELIQVDIAHDIALLVPKNIEILSLLESSIGLKPRTALPSLDCGQVNDFAITFWGYAQPYNSVIVRKGDVICRPQLRERVPPSHPQRPALETRQSPQLSIYILETNIDATGGDAGGPLLAEQDNQVVGIVIGGLPDTISNAWAVPWPDIEFVPVPQMEIELSALAEYNLPDSVR